MDEDSFCFVKEDSEDGVCFVHVAELWDCFVKVGAEDWLMFVYVGVEDGVVPVHGFGRYVRTAENPVRANEAKAATRWNILPSNAAKPVKANAPYAAERIAPAGVHVPPEVNVQMS